MFDRFFRYKLGGLEDEEKVLPYGICRDGHIMIRSNDWENLRFEVSARIGISYADFIRLENYQTVDSVLAFIANLNCESHGNQLPESVSVPRPDVWTRRLSRFPRTALEQRGQDFIFGDFSPSSDEHQPNRLADEFVNCCP